MIPKSQYPSGTIGGSSSLAIYLGNETDSGISSIDHSTPVKSMGVKRQHLTSTPKSQLKLISATQQQMAELSAKQQEVPHGAHMRHDHGGSARAGGLGDELRGRRPSCKIWEGSLDSSITSIDDHAQLTTKHLMERDDPSQNCSILSSGEDIMSVHDSSDIEMASNLGPPEHHSEDSSPDSAPEGKHSVIDPGTGDHPDSSPESNSGSADSDSEPDSGSSSDSKDSDNSNEGIPSDMSSAKKTHRPTTKKQESWPQSSSHSWSQEIEPQKRVHTPSPENDPHPDKLEWKRKNPSPGKSETPKGPSKTTPKAVDKTAQEIGEDVIQKFQEEEHKQDCQSQPKKSKKDSDHEAKETAQKKEQEEYQKQNKKKKKEKEAKEWKEREEREAQETKRWAEQQQLEPDKRTARAKLLHTVWNEKYSKELPELQAYQNRYVTNNQRVTVNLDSHVRYLEMIWQDKSLYPNRNIILGTWLIEQLRKNHRDTEADNVQAIIDKGFRSHALVIKPLYFIRCLQRSNGEMLDSQDDNYGDDQNIGLHDLVSQPSMQCLCTSWKVTVNNRRLLTPIDAGFCPFCEYHSSCHKTLNNHVRIHLSLSLFCGIGGCFFTTSDCKALIQHAITEHPSYEKSKELNPKKGGSR